jgi:thioredoxin 1
MFSPLMEEIGQTYTVEKINVDENQELTNKYNVRGVPTVILVENDVELWKTVGVTSKTTLTEAYDRF